MEDGKLFVSAETHSTTMNGEFVSNNKEKDQTPSSKETKHYESFSGYNSMKSLGELSWRHKNILDRNKIEDFEQHIYSFRYTSSTSSSPYSWRNKEGRPCTTNKGKEIVKSKHSFWSNSPASDHCNWRSKKELPVEETSQSVENRWRNSKSYLSDESLKKRGYWCFKCDSQRSSPSELSETDIIWSALRDLHEENSETFSFSPSKNQFSKGYSKIRCYTPDYSDLTSILKTATIIRERIDFPYLINYYRVNKSNVSICLYMYTHAGELYKKSKKDWVLCDQ